MAIHYKVCLEICWSVFDEASDGSRGALSSMLTAGDARNQRAYSSTGRARWNASESSERKPRDSLPHFAVAFSETQKTYKLF